MTFFVHENKNNEIILYIILKSDDGSKNFIYSKNYSQGAYSDWEHVTSPLEEDVVRASIFNHAPKEVEIDQTSSFLEQIQRELLEQTFDESDEISQNLQIYGQCRKSIYEAYKESLKYSQENEDALSHVDFDSFEDDWFNVYGTEFIQSKGDDGISIC